jgi:plastocyanin
MSEEENTTQETKSSKTTWIILAVLIGIVVIGGYYFMTMNNSSENIGQSNTQPSNSNLKDTAVKDAQVNPAQNKAKQITIEGNEFAYTPSTFTVNKGDMVELTFKNTGKYPHDLIIDELGVKTSTIQSGEQVVISFSPEKQGNFEFACSLPGHADKGMIGTITVK